MEAKSKCWKQRWRNSHRQLRSTCLTNQIKINTGRETGTDGRKAKVFNNTSDSTIGEKKSMCNTGSNTGKDGGKMEAKSKCLTTVAMEQL